eukprot:8825873-Alexandrium_andersonii.AAC.1
MSASLVGSEMCIRDRRRRVPFGTATSKAGFGARYLTLTRGSGDLVGCSCLLYTSDAADDM